MKKLCVVLSVVLLCCLSVTSFGSLNVNDSSIISLYQLNEQTSGALTNNTPGSFVDSAITGTPQNHDDITWPAPDWGSGSAFAGIGDGIGLTFDKVNQEQTRFSPWMNQTQGNYTNGKSFTIMTRLNASSLVDNASYGLLGSSSNNISIDGISGNRGRINVRIREGADEQSWYFNSFVSGGDPGISGDGFMSINPNTWYNLFVIYNADSSITIATDDGTTFQWIKTVNVPVGFSTMANGYSDADRHFVVGNTYAGLGVYPNFDGRIESIAIWDKALTNAEADAIGFVNVPEPITMVFLGAGFLAMIRRK